MTGKVNAILAVVVGGAIDAVSSELIDGNDFNFTNGIKRLSCIALAGGIIAVVTWIITRNGTSKKGSG